MAQADHASNAIRPLVTAANAKPPCNPIQAAHADFVTALAANRPRPIPLFPRAGDLEDRANQLQKILDSVAVYVTATLDDAAQNVPGGLDLDFVDALLADLVSEATGALRRAADRVTEDTTGRSA